MKKSQASKKTDDRSALLKSGLKERWESLTPEGRAAADAVFCMAIDDEIRRGRVKTLPVGAAGASDLNDSDRRLLEAARDARNEGGSFEQMYRSMGAINGVLAMLSHIITTAPVDDEISLDWCSIGHTLADLRAGGMNVYCALGELARFEREREDNRCAAAEVH